MSNAIVPAGNKALKTADDILSFLTNLDNELAGAYDAVDVISLKTAVEAAAFLSKKLDLDKDIQRRASEGVIDTKRRLGEILEETPKNVGAMGNPGGQGVRSYDDTTQTYAEIGITKQEAHQFQTIAKLPEEDYEDFKHDAKVSGYEITSTGVYKYAKNWLRAHKPTPAKTTIPTSLSVIHGEMEETLHNWTGAAFDLVIADPPYNVTEWEWDRIGDQFLDITSNWLAHCMNVCKPEYNLFWFCSAKYMADIEMVMRDMQLPIQSRIVWHRRNMAKGSDAKNKFIDSYEMIFHIGTRALNFPANWTDDRFDVQTFAVPQTNFTDTKYHPTQKPLELIRRLVAFGSYPGDRVLDPFAGGGTTGEACLLEADRTCVMIEKDAEYVEVINNRLNK